MPHVALEPPFEEAWYKSVRFQFGSDVNAVVVVCAYQHISLMHMHMLCGIMLTRELNTASSKWASMPLPT